MSINSRPAARVLSAMSYGPCSYVWSIVIGFVIGSLGWLVQEATSYHVDHSYFDELRMLALYAGGAMVLSLAAAIVLNFFIGRRLWYTYQASPTLRTPESMAGPARSN